MTTSNLKNKLTPFVEMVDSVEILINNVVEDSTSLEQLVKDLEVIKKKASDEITKAKKEAVATGQARIDLGDHYTKVPTQDHYTQPISWWIRQEDKRPEARKNPEELGNNLRIVNLLIEQNLHGDNAQELFRKGKRKETFHWN